MFKKQKNILSALIVKSAMKYKCIYVININEAIAIYSKRYMQKLPNTNRQFCILLFFHKFKEMFFYKQSPFWSACRDDFLIRYL